MADTPYNLQYFIDDRGEAPFTQWLYSLRDKVAFYRIRARLDRVALALWNDKARRRWGLGIED